MLRSRNNILFVQTIGNKRRKKLTTSLAKKIHDNWRKFCDETKLAGLNLIGGTLNVSKLDRGILFTVWSICFALCLYKCNTSVVDYLKYDVKTAFVYNRVDRLNFPAITFCNVNELRKSVIGMTNEVIGLMSQWTSQKRDDVASAVKRNLRICKVKTRNMNVSHAIVHKLLNAITRNDFQTLYKEITVDSTISAIGCWWNNKKINCNLLFLNHPVDNKMCFTFNQDADFADYGQWTKAYAVYGARNQTLTTTGNFASRRNGLKLLLNVRQEEYCASPSWVGAGFYVMIHDTKTLSSLNMEDVLRLSPGFEYTVIMKPVTYDRRNFSEWLGRCTTKVYNFMKPNEKQYSQKTCFASCVAQKMFENCKCLPILPNSSLESQSTAKFLKTTIKDLRSCDLTADEWCIKDQFYKFVYDVEINPCPKCKKNCLETKYDVQISAKRMSRDTLMKLRSQLYRTNKVIEKNYLTISFGFHEMNLLTVTDFQEITALDLFMSISGTVGLFLGGSVITFYEIVHRFLLTFSIFLNHFETTSKLKRMFIKTGKLIKQFPHRFTSCIRKCVCVRKRKRQKRKKVKQMDTKVATDKKHTTAVPHLQMYETKADVQRQNKQTRTQSFEHVVLLT